MNPILYLVVPCYNEEDVLPITAPMFLEKLSSLIESQKISDSSKLLLVNDGSRDKTWEIISALSKENPLVEGISLSRNRGHQNALLAGLMEAKERSDITISIDCDGQDDINAVDKMIEEYIAGADVVYGVRSSRKKDGFFKRTTAQGFYKFMNRMGADVVYNHADYRLLSKRVLEALSEFKEVNLFLRGMIPLVGFKSTAVYYERTERIAGESKYPLRKMLALAFDGITSLSVKPIRMITAFGFFIALLSIVGIIYSVIIAFIGRSEAGWSSIVSIVCLVSGVQLLSLGVIGEYIGKIYLETKNRPKYIVSEKTEEK